VPQMKAGHAEALVLHSWRKYCCTNKRRRGRRAMQRPQRSTREGQLLHKYKQKKTGHAEASVLHSGRTKLLHECQ